MGRGHGGDTSWSSSRVNLKAEAGTLSEVEQSHLVGPGQGPSPGLGNPQDLEEEVEADCSWQRPEPKARVPTSQSFPMRLASALRHVLGDRS